MDFPPGPVREHPIAQCELSDLLPLVLLELFTARLRVFEGHWKLPPSYIPIKQLGFVK